MSDGYELLAGILEGVPQPVWVVDHPGRILFANPAAVRALGYDRADELLGRGSHATVHYKRVDGSRYPVEECPMLRPRLTGETVHVDEDWFVRRDGTVFPVAWWSAALETPDGRGAVVSFTDITDRLEDERIARDRDAAEVRATEAQAAQRRGVESERAIRRQVARDLDDGAHQRMAAVLQALDLAQGSIEATAPTSMLLERARDEAREAVVELQQLAAGVYPAVLTDHGLAAAVSALGARIPVPVTVVDTTRTRSGETVEAHAYFLVAEALTNTVKHARASRATVTLDDDADRLVISVSDDGVGGADETAGGSGLLGLADRLAALDGTLVVTSPPGGGTVVRAEIPSRIGEET